MTITTAITLLREVFIKIMLIGGILIIPSFIVGIIISIFQATTQIQEQTLTFLPKVIITFVMLIVFGSFILTTLATIFTGAVNSIPTLIR